MINKITFTGREEMLTKGIGKGVETVSSKMHDYIGVGKIFSEKDIKTGKELAQHIHKKVIVAPEIVIPVKTEAVEEPVNMLNSQAANVSYAISHGKNEAQMTNLGSRIHTFY